MRKVLERAAVAAACGLAACTSGELTVQASVERADGSISALPNLLVRVLPYDREQIFEELERAYGVPEPRIPDSLKVLQDAIAQAQAEWSNAETIWNSARDSLKVLSDRMEGMSRSSAQYALAYGNFNAQDSVVQRAEQVSKRAHDRFEALQQRYYEQADSVRLARAAWADRAFAQVNSVIQERIEEAGSREYGDTTDANGVATFEGLKHGRYWIHARYEQPYDELYWNVPVELRGEPATVQLNRQTAQVRPKL
jgi:hypothetical protein